MKMEALVNGYAEGIALDAHGFAHRGQRARTCSSVYKGELYTPPLAASILVGITRDTVITLARELGIDGARGS